MHPKVVTVLIKWKNNYFSLASSLHNSSVCAHVCVCVVCWCAHICMFLNISRWKNACMSQDTNLSNNRLVACSTNALLFYVDSLPIQVWLQISQHGVQVGGWGGLHWAHWIGRWWTGWWLAGQWATLHWLCVSRFWLHPGIICLPCCALHLKHKPELCSQHASIKNSFGNLMTHQRLATSRSLIWKRSKLICFIWTKHTPQCCVVHTQM